MVGHVAATAVIVRVAHVEGAAWRRVAGLEAEEGVGGTGGVKEGVFVDVGFDIGVGE